MSVVPDQILTLLGIGTGGGLAGYVRRVDGRSRKAKEIAEQNRKRLAGTEDPNDEGALDIIYETRQRVEDLEDSVDDGFREVNIRLDRMNGGPYDYSADDD